jgi:hypothetical protein
MKKFTVGTFYDPIEPLLKSRVSAYTCWYSNSWPGCVEFEVEAASGVEAKKLAKDLRLEHELKKKA